MGIELVLLLSVLGALVAVGAVFNEYKRRRAANKKWEEFKKDESMRKL